MNKQLLTEWNKLDYSKKTLTESREKNNGKLILQGVLQRANTKNQNKRIYPMEILKREMDNYQKAIRERRAVGELDHPESSTVSLQNASHVVTEAWWDGETCHGRIEVLPTPRGKILESLLESEIMFGISSRGVGSTDKTNEGLDQVQDDYQLIAYDVVSEPSTPGAYLFAEGRRIDVDPRRIFTRQDRIYRALNDIVRG
jgi:hypothetical protein